MLPDEIEGIALLLAIGVPKLPQHILRDKTLDHRPQSTCLHIRIGRGAVVDNAIFVRRQIFGIAIKPFPVDVTKVVATDAHMLN